ncbi:MAG: hypothetical protein QN122_05460 [Armatimonadota bacterium]|nr:hypothetical protein [Armatimonadota bacterium]MDR7449519.1 hypothetical protein [Armatimonadota bacterium]MDR7479713.1 hypothetical protein [Armatimonadota bacterium]MDR7489114.1 hypothetical protein [Armatimonadota bacterium]MDR7490882.1 hypothetical protein [Armatimonadota bacterium]
MPQPARVYFTGGATALLYGWRETTLDVDVKLVPGNSTPCPQAPGPWAAKSLDEANPQEWYDGSSLPVP